MEVRFGGLVRLLHLCAHQEATAAMVQLGLTPAQGRMMLFLAHAQEQPCPRDLEAAFHLSHATVSGLLSRMEQKGLLELRADLVDRRCKRIHLLPKGLELEEQIRCALDENDRRMVRDFTQQEWEQFASFLRRAIQNMGGSEQCRPSQEECET